MGADVLNGGGGVDYADYADATAGLIVTVNPTSNTGEAAGDAFISIERLRGSSFDDTLTGNANNNHLVGGRGADVARRDNVSAAPAHKVIVVGIPGQGVVKAGAAQPLIEMKASPAASPVLLVGSTRFTINPAVASA